MPLRSVLATHGGRYPDVSDLAVASYDIFAAAKRLDFDQNGKKDRLARPRFECRRVGKAFSTVGGDGRGQLRRWANKARS